MELTASPRYTTHTLLIPPTPRSRIPVKFNPSFPNPQRRISSNPRITNKNPAFITRCSAKPNTDDRDSVIKDQDSTFKPNSELNIHNPQKPNSNQESSSPNSSSLSRGLVFDLGSEDSWDDIEVGAPVVRRFLSDEEERWYMWYCGRSRRNSNSGSGSIGLAVSSNGIHWERGKGKVQSGNDVGLVLNSSNDWWSFDTNGIMPGEVVVMSSSKIKASNAVYWLYYTGFSNENFECLDSSLEFILENPQKRGIGLAISDDGDDNGGKILKSLPGLAMSQDGRHWARIEGEHHSGALFDVGSEGEWDSMFISSPQVVFHGSGDLRMYYHSFDMEKGEFGIGMARSRDGMRWVKLGKIMGGGRSGSFDEYGVMNPFVVKNKKDGKYLMVYEGVGVEGKRSIGLAQSPNGLKDWQRIEDEAILKWGEEDGCWDDEGVGSPCLVQMEGDEDEWRLYYRGIGKGGRTGIGMAVSGGKDTWSFRRWTGFHL